MIDIFKQSDDVSDVIKHTDDIHDAVKEADKVADDAKTASKLTEASEDSAKYVDDINDVAKTADKISSIPNAEELKMSQTVQNHINDVIKRGQNAGELSRPYIESNGTVLLLQEIMEATDPVQDEFVKTALRWDTPGVFRGTSGVWELVVDTSTNTVLHFNFVA